MSDGTWSFNADSGFVSYRGFDCWLEKNGTGQMTTRLDPHSGWTFDLDALKKSKYFKARINKDGSLTIVVDRMYRWMTDVTLLIPLKKVAHQKNAASDGESASGSANVTIKDSGESYEKATEFCTLTYDLDGGAFNNGTEYEETGMVERAIAIGEEITFDEIPAKDGYVFKYWEEVLPDDVVEDSGDEEEPPRYEEGDKYTVTGDVTFKAIWEKE